MTLDTTYTAGLSGSYSKAVGLSTATWNYPLAATIQKQLTDGTAIGKADLVYASAPGGRTIALSSSEDLDLSGIITDVTATVLTFVRIKVIFIYAYATNINSVVFGGGSNPFLGPWSGTLTVPPDGVALLTHPGTAGAANGWTVTPATGDILHVANSGAGTSVTYDLILVGGSAAT